MTEVRKEHKLRLRFGKWHLMLWTDERFDAFLGPFDYDDRQRAIDAAEKAGYVAER